MARQFANRHEKMMEALWNEYDKNSTSTRAQPLCDLICAEDGHLQIDELMKMQLHALQQNVEQVDDNVVTAIDSFFEALEVSTVLSAALTGSWCMWQTTYETQGLSAEDLEGIKAQRNTFIQSAKSKAHRQLEMVHGIQLVHYHDSVFRTLYIYMRF